MEPTKPQDGTDPARAGFVWNGNSWQYPPGMGGIGYFEWSQQHGGDSSVGTGNPAPQQQIDAATGQPLQQGNIGIVPSMASQPGSLPQVGDYSGFNAQLPNYGLNPADYAKLTQEVFGTAGSPTTNTVGMGVDPVSGMGFGAGGTPSNNLLDSSQTPATGSPLPNISDILGSLGTGQGTSVSTPISTDKNGNIIIYNQNQGGNNSGGNSAAPAPESMLDKLLPYLIAGGSDLVGGLLGNNSAKDAAQIQADAANKAAELEAQTAANSLAFTKGVYGTSQAQNAPFLAAGTDALSQVQKLLAPGGAESQDFVAPTQQQVEQSPGYQLQLDAANKALGYQSKGVTSGGTLKAAERYATDYGDTKYNDAVNQAMNIFQTNRSNRLNPLMQIAGYGPTAVAQNTAAGQNAAATSANISQNSTSAINGLNTGSAYQTAQGMVSGTNALTNALNQIASLAVKGVSR